MYEEQPSSFEGVTIYPSHVFYPLADSKKWHSNSATDYADLVRRRLH
jgi:hypothetical protein